MKRKAKPARAATPPAEKPAIARPPEDIPDQFQSFADMLATETANGWIVKAVIAMDPDRRQRWVEAIEIAIANLNTTKRVIIATEQLLGQQQGSPDPQIADLVKDGLRIILRPGEGTPWP